ncbi:MAG TPA: alkaline phosphatase family protein, partial [Gemmatimonadales bacterium]|nr:alkaline phosphatase family protein [Gemmatimonadales bacterium]
AAVVTVAIGTDPSNGTLSGTTTMAAVAGVATFAGLSIDKTGTGYTLTASATGVTSATSGAFDIVTTQLAFTTQPGTTVAATGITPAITVAATIPGGGTDPSFTGSVTIAIGANPASGSLSGTKTVNAVAGVAAFADLHIDKAGTGYTLAATSPGAGGATSGTFSVIAGAAAQLTFTVQPSVTAAGAGITPAVAVTASDLAGNLATSYSGAVTVAIGANPGSGTLSGTATQSAVAGVATFTGLSINSAGTGYTLVASANGVTSATSGSFDVTTVQSGPLPSFGHVVIVVEENTSFSEVSDTTMPYLHSLMAQYGLATQYYANTHPSIGNYFEMTAGQIITNDDSYQLTVPADNIVRHLLAAGKTWKDYAEDLPSVGYTGPSTGNYGRKHNPLSFFSDVVNDSVQVKRLVPFTQFALDLAGDTLPNYSFIVPNLCNDAHDCPLSTADTWLQTNIAPLLNNASFKRDGLLIITFDEASGDDTNGGGRVVWTVISPKAKTAYVSTTLYQHQSTLRLSAEALGLTSFPGDAATASNMAEFFHP